MRQLYRAHAVLFVCAYAGFLGYFAVTDPRIPLATLLSRAVLKSGTGVQSNAEERPLPPSATLPPGVAPSSGNSADQKVSLTDAVSSEAVSEDGSAQQQERARLSEIGLQATRAEEPQQRAAAIDQLNAATPETLQALQTVITSDSAVRNRIRAVNSLRILAEREGAHDAVISILHLAMVDANSSVASRATEVYRELTQERAPGA